MSILGENVICTQKACRKDQDKANIWFVIKKIAMPLSFIEKQNSIPLKYLWEINNLYSEKMLEISTEIKYKALRVIS